MEHDFAGFLHNPYEEKYLSKKQMAAVTIFKRKGRFVDGYCPQQELRSLILKFFGDVDKLYKDGLVHHYHLLKKEVENKWLIGLILFGANPNNLGKIEQKVASYTTNTSKKINLTLTGICRHLLEDYLGYFDEDDDRIDQLCEKTPGFKIYYS